MTSTADVEILGLDWPDFLDYFAEEWKPGEHVAIVAPTGQAKTTLACGIVSQRRYCLAADPKGGDSTLKSLGWPRLPKWPPPEDVYKAIEKGEPARFRLGNVVRTEADLDRLAATLRSALIGVFEEGGWTLLLDEAQVMAEEMALAKPMKKLLIAARDRKVSVVSLFQRPADVPRALSDQASWLCVGLTRDVDVVNRLAEMMGRPAAEIRGRVEGLRTTPYSWLVASNNPRVPMLVTVTWRPKPPPKRHNAKSKLGRTWFG